MRQLVEALAIFLKYIPNVAHPMHCEHDELTVLCDPDTVSGVDETRLSELGFVADRGEHSFRSYRFGSA